MITLTASLVRSISMRGMPAEPNSFCTCLRILLSCRSRRPKSFLVAYQRERHGSMVPRRKPVGWIFCPMVVGASGLLALSLARRSRLPAFVLLGLAFCLITLCLGALLLGGGRNFCSLGLRAL